MSIVGGIKTRWLFADELEKGKEYLGELTGEGEHTCVKEETKGQTVPYVVWVGAIDGEPAEYQLSKWRLESSEPFDASKPGKFYISRKGNNVFFKPFVEDAH